MQKIERYITQKFLKRLENNPAVALLGARQVGKSTLAKMIVGQFEKSVYLDLELDSDREKIEQDRELFLSVNADKLICLDEIQHLPELFKVLRGVIDSKERNTQFLILGSASRDLIKQSGETLAGRIAYLEITPFLRLEVLDINFFEYWLRGGYPRSLLAKDDETSFSWRNDYIKSFLERDLPSLGFRVPASVLKKFWTMLAHTQGQLMNYAKLASSLDVSIHAIKNYIHILEETLVVRVLQPYYTNEKKRLVKSPKVYIRDTGILHSLLRIHEINDLLGHPVVGGSFETLVIENIITSFSKWDAYFYRDSTGNEIDLVLKKGLKKIAIEIKSSTAPKIGKGFWNSVKFLKPDEMWCIAQVDSKYPGGDGAWITNLELFLEEKLDEM
ncbi:MAG: ATP-binding protein [Bacteriovoracaceae bacterium]